MSGFDTSFISKSWYSQVRYATKRGEFTSPLACLLLGLIVNPFWVKDETDSPVAVDTSWTTSKFCLTPDLWSNWAITLGTTVRVLKDEMEVLTNVGMVKIAPPLSGEEVVELLKSKIPQQPTFLSCSACSWCNCRTLILHEHHYPIPKAQNGTDVVQVCPNCHSEFHALVEAPWLQITAKVFEGIELNQERKEQ